MTWWWWVLTILAGLYIAGRVWAYARGAPDMADIKFHFRSRFARAMAKSVVSKSNFAVTIGRHTFVRLDVIRGQHRGHEYKHALQAHAMSIPWFLAVWCYQMVRYGYRASPLETAAVAFAEAHGHEFPEARRPDG